MDDLRFCYENFFQIFVFNLEMVNDCIFVELIEGFVLGVEFFVVCCSGGKFDWWVNYVWLEVEDMIDGVDVLCVIDQIYVFNLSFNW